MDIPWNWSPMRIIVVSAPRAFSSSSFQSKGILHDIPGVLCMLEVSWDDSLGAMNAEVEWFQSREHLLTSIIKDGCLPGMTKEWTFFLDAGLNTMGLPPEMEVCTRRMTVKE